MAEKYIDLADQIAEDMSWGTAITRDVCRWLDAHPEQVPRPRMTYSELAEEVKSVERVEKRFEAVAYVLTNLGFTICSDPEPTNAEKLEAIMADVGVNEVGFNVIPKAFAEFLDRRGVKAPGGDDD